MSTLGYHHTEKTKKKMSRLRTRSQHMKTHASIFKLVSKLLTTNIIYFNRKELIYKFKG